MILDILKPIVERVWSAIGDRRRIRFTVHRGVFVASGKECFFLNLSNLSRNREIEITHVYMDCGEQIHALQSNRLLPKRLRPDESWETWIEVDRIPNSLRGIAFTLGRARLSSGKILKSDENKNVPHAGTVAGGPTSPN
jgi:hypothetical protein